MATGFCVEKRVTEFTVFLCYTESTIVSRLRSAAQQQYTLFNSIKFTLLLSICVGMCVCRCNKLTHNIIAHSPLAVFITLTLFV